MGQVTDIMPMDARSFPAHGMRVQVLGNFGFMKWDRPGMCDEVLVWFWGLFGDVGGNERGIARVLNVCVVGMREMRGDGYWAYEFIMDVDVWGNGWYVIL